MTTTGVWVDSSRQKHGQVVSQVGSTPSGGGGAVSHPLPPVARADVNAATQKITRVPVPLRSRRYALRLAGNCFFHVCVGRFWVRAFGGSGWAQASATIPRPSEWVSQEAASGRGLWEGSEVGWGLGVVVQIRSAAGPSPRLGYVSVASGRLVSRKD